LFPIFNSMIFGFYSTYQSSPSMMIYQSPYGNYLHFATDTEFKIPHPAVKFSLTCPSPPLFKQKNMN
jgi:hypothetical protein